MYEFTVGLVEITFPCGMSLFPFVKILHNNGHNGKVLLKKKSTMGSVLRALEGFKQTISRYTAVRKITFGLVNYFVVYNAISS